MGKNEKDCACDPKNALICGDHFLGFLEKVRNLKSEVDERKASGIEMGWAEAVTKVQKLYEPTPQDKNTEQSESK